MFDDIDNTPTTSASAPTQPHSTPQSRPRPIQPAPPSNLPLGGQSIPNAPLPEDIFSPTDAIPFVSAPQSPPPLITPLGGMSETPLGAPLPPPLKDGRGGLRKVIVFFLCALIIAFLGIGAYLAYRILKAQRSVDVLNQPIESGAENSGESKEEQREEGAADRTPGEPKEDTGDEGEESAANQEEGDAGIEEEPEENEIPSPEPPSEQPPPSDTDNDGLRDLEELELGSNPRIIDTDIDGLDDYSEARIYHSNPARRDTDGDGYDDGLEVQNGYNPTGIGKLISE